MRGERPHRAREGEQLGEAEPVERVAHSQEEDARGGRERVPPPARERADQGELGRSGEHQQAERTRLEQGEATARGGHSEGEAGESDGDADAERVPDDSGIGVLRLIHAR